MKRQQRCSGILSHHNYVKRQHFCSRPVCVCVWESPNRRLLCTLQSGAAPTLGPQAGGRPTEIFQRWNDTVGRRTPLEGSDSDSKLRRLILSCCFELVTLTWNITRKSKSATFPTVTFDTDMAHKFKEKKKKQQQKQWCEHLHNMEVEPVTKLLSFTVSSLESTGRHVKARE